MDTKKVLLALITLALLLSGCGGKIYLIESKHHISAGRDADPATVSRAKNFEIYREQIKNIAVQAPDMCVNESQSASTGKTSNRRVQRKKYNSEVMKTSCGVEMANIEKSLTEAGYKVVSWKVLQHQMANKATDRIVGANIAAAEELGADALFQINSMERGISAVARDARWDRRYYDSDISGKKRGSASVKKSISKKFDNEIEKKEEVLGQDFYTLTATINSSVTFVDSAQVIWFYDWENKGTLDGNDSLKTKVYMSCGGKVCNRYKPRNKNQDDAKDDDELTEGSSRAISVGANIRDRQKYVQDKLLKVAIQDMVKNFSE